jgi:phosphatidylserine decarboxylase
VHLTFLVLRIVCFATLFEGSILTDIFRVVTRTGWDMDPFVVISFGKKVFRTRVIRHHRNPVWDEKLLFHVRRYETAFNINFAVLDWDKLSSNDHIGDVSVAVKELIENSPQPDPETGLYPDRSDEHLMKAYDLPLQTEKDVKWDAKHNPKLTFKYIHCVIFRSSISHRHM